MLLGFRRPLYSCTEGMCHSSTRPGTSYHVTEFYQAFPRVSTASDKRWGEKAWVRGYKSPDWSNVRCAVHPSWAMNYLPSRMQNDVKLPLEQRRQYVTTHSYYVHCVVNSDTVRCRHYVHCVVNSDTVRCRLQLTHTMWPVTDVVMTVLSDFPSCSHTCNASDSGHLSLASQVCPTTSRVWFPHCHCHHSMTVQKPHSCWLVCSDSLVGPYLV